jgi:two-component sensor histidine kinase
MSTERSGKNPDGEPLRDELARLRGELAAVQARHEAQIVEMRHRVFNHLQMVVSLIRLRLRRTQNDETRRQLTALENYIVALSLLQRHLDTEGTGADFAIYLKDQAALWRPLFAERNLAIAVSAEGGPVAAAKAVPLALIVNELVTNAYKHAFPEGRRSGTVRIAFQTQEPPWLTLSVTDDGVGMLEDVPAGSVGQTVIKILAAQIGAQVSREAGRAGTSVRLRFTAE